MNFKPHPKDLSKSPAVAGFFVSPHLSLHSTVKFLYIHNIITLIITNFMSWALDERSKIQPLSLKMFNQGV